MMATKRDQACIWFSHLPEALARRFEGLESDSPVRLLINGSETLWRRMRPGGGRPTRGLRIEAGKEFWNAIDLGSQFTITVASAGEAITPLAPSVEAPPLDRVLVSGPALFGAYLFVDYSGAAGASQQRSAIRIAHAAGAKPPIVVESRYDRTSLVGFIVGYLQAASRDGVRVCLGQDHAFGIPIGLARELGISDLQWRDALDAFLCGRYDSDGPRFVDVRRFACDMNRWLTKRGRKPYFWSATKADAYQLPGRDPRSGDPDGCTYRLTDRCRSRSGRGRPKPFNRVGDPGTVGGQSLLGMVRIRELSEACERLGINLRFWPFDGLDILGPEYEGAHVAIEPYPSAFRPEDVEQTDANDALYTTLAIQEADLRGEGPGLFDLSELGASEMDRVRFEGWIVGHLAGNQP